MKRLPVIAGIVAIAAVVALCWHWMPARQVRLHQRDFLRAIEDRDWPRVSGFIAPDFQDAWGHNRETVMSTLPDAFRDFLACGLLAEETAIGRENRNLILFEKIRVVGSGGPIAQYMMSESERLTQPFAFSWRQASWKPWHWELVSVAQPELTGL